VKSKGPVRGEKFLAFFGLVALIFGFTAWCLWCLALSARFVFRIKKVVWALAAVQAALVKKLSANSFSENP
jgi:hypothetical protein